MWNRAKGAGRGALKRQTDRQDQIQELFGKGWDAIKNEFGGSAEASIPDTSTANLEHPSVTRARYLSNLGEDAPVFNPMALLTGQKRREDW